MNVRLVACMLSLLGCAPVRSVLAQTPAASAAPAPYHLLNKVPLGGEGGWDYLLADSAGQRLYVSHGTQVEIVDLTTHQKVGVVPNTPGVHGIVVVPGLGRGFITCGRSNTVVIFDLKTLSVVGSVVADKNPDALLYDAFSGRVFVFNNEGNSATAIDAASGKAVGTVALGGAAEAGASNKHGLIYVNLEDKSEVVTFDAKTLKVKSRWSLAPGEEPTGLALDPVHHRLFSACHNQKLIVLDELTGKRVAELPIGSRVDGVVFDPASQQIISSNGEGTFTVIHEDTPDRYRVVATVPTERGARTISLDPRTHHLFTSTAEYGAAPAATDAIPHPRPSIVPGTFRVLEFGQ